MFRCVYICMCTQNIYIMRQLDYLNTIWCIFIHSCLFSFLFFFFLIFTSRCFSIMVLFLILLHIITNHGQILYCGSSFFLTNDIVSITYVVTEQVSRWVVSWCKKLLLSMAFIGTWIHISENAGNHQQQSH